MDLIIFESNNQKFGINSDYVREILDPIAVTPVPFAPSYVDGLISATGDIIIQINFNKKLQLNVPEPALAADDELEHVGHILVLTSKKGMYALRVERVLEKLTVSDADLLSVGNTASASEYRHNREIIGEINLNQQVLLIVDENELGLEDQFSTFQGVESDMTLGQSVTLKTNSEVSEEINGTLIIQVGAEFFALHLRDVQEIVKIRIKHEVTHLPHAPQEIYGLYLLRGAALVTFSLAKLFDIQNVDDEIFGIVTQTKAGRVILCVEHMHGIHYFKSNIQEPSIADKHFKGWIRGKHDEMVGVIDTNALFNDDKLEEYAVFLVDNAEHSAVQDVVETQKFLSFWIGSEICCLALHHVSQVAECNAETQLPHSIIDHSVSDQSKLHLISGVTQIQGIVMPVVDLHSVFHQTSDSTLRETKKGQYIIVNCEEHVFALLVDKIDRVVDLSMDQIETEFNNSNEFVSAICKIQGKLAAILSLKPLQQYNEHMNMQKEKYS